MFSKIHRKRFIFSTLIVGAIAILSILFLLFTAHGTFERGTMGHFVGWISSIIVHLLAIPFVYIGERIHLSQSEFVLVIEFAIDCILYGFLIERVITVISKFK